MEKVIDSERIENVNYACIFELMFKNEKIGTEYILSDGRIKGIVQGNRTILSKE